MGNIEFTAELIAEIVDKFNNGMKKTELAAMYGTSEKTLQRRIKDFGWTYDNRTNKYIKVDGVVSENIQPKITKTKTNKVKVKVKDKNKSVGRPAAKLEGVEYVKRTYNIPKELDKKLKVAAIEKELTTTELLQEILQKYFK